MKMSLLLMVPWISWDLELGEQLPSSTVFPEESVTLPVTSMIEPTSVEMTPRRPKFWPLVSVEGALPPEMETVGVLSPDEGLLTTEKDWETRVLVVILLPFFAVAVKV